jgi:hypothetical protein
VLTEVQWPWIQNVNKTHYADPISAMQTATVLLYVANRKTAEEK